MEPVRKPKRVRTGKKKGKTYRNQEATDFPPQEDISFQPRQSITQSQDFMYPQPQGFPGFHPHNNTELQSQGSTDHPSPGMIVSHPQESMQPQPQEFIPFQHQLMMDAQPHRIASSPAQSFVGSQALKINNSEPEKIKTATPDIPQLPDLTFLKPHRARAHQSTPKKSTSRIYPLSLESPNPYSLDQKHHKHKHNHRSPPPPTRTSSRPTNNTPILPTPTSLINPKSSNRHGIPQLQALRQAEAWFAGTEKSLRDRLTLATEMRTTLNELVGNLETFQKESSNYYYEDDGEEEEEEEEATEDETPDEDEDEDEDEYDSDESINIITEMPDPHNLTTNINTINSINSITENLNSMSLTPPPPPQQQQDHNDNLSNKINQNIQTLRITRAKWNANVGGTSGKGLI